MKKNSPTTPMIGNFTPTVWKSVYKKTNFNFLPPTFIEKLPKLGCRTKQNTNNYKNTLYNKHEVLYSF